MAKEKNIQDVIDKFERTHVRILSLHTDIRYYDGLRHVSGLIPKSDEQVKSEKELEEKSSMMKILKNEIAQRLGVEAVVAEMKPDEFWDFLQKR